MEIINAKDLIVEDARKLRIEELKTNVMYNIQEACKEGKRETIYDEWNVKDILNYPEVKEAFIKAGYTFKTKTIKDCCRTKYGVKYFQRDVVHICW